MRWRTVSDAANPAATETAHHLISGQIAGSSLVLVATRKLGLLGAGLGLGGLVIWRWLGWVAW
jgi:hypothetical protein